MAELASAKYVVSGGRALKNPVTNVIKSATNVIKSKTKLYNLKLV
jgi:hypothetical protein